MTDLYSEIVVGVAGFGADRPKCCRSMLISNVMTWIALISNAGDDF